LPAHHHHPRRKFFFATGLDDAARLAVELANNPPKLSGDDDLPVKKFTKEQKYFAVCSQWHAGYEAQHILAGYMPKVLANSPINKEFQLPDAFVSQENCIVDLGEMNSPRAACTPMMDNEHRIRRLYEEARRDPEVAVIMLDIVIGYGSHPDPAIEIATRHR
jgi:FdrA protein